MQIHYLNEIFIFQPVQKRKIHLKVMRRLFADKPSGDIESVQTSCIALINPRTNFTAISVMNAVSELVYEYKHPNKSLCHNRDIYYVRFVQVWNIQLSRTFIMVLQAFHQTCIYCISSGIRHAYTEVSYTNPPPWPFSYHRYNGQYYRWIPRFAS